jgi:plasmid stability protein
MKLLWSYAATTRTGGSEMPVDLSIKHVPEALAKRLRQRAARHHRSLQGELMAMLEQHLAEEGRLTLAEALELARADGLSTPAESVEMIRTDRDDPNRGEPRPG